MHLSHTCGLKTLISAVAQKCHGNFNLLIRHGISICWRQFQFTHGNFSLLAAISFYSQQFQLTSIFSLPSPPVNYSSRQWPPKVKKRKIKSWYLKSIFKVKSENQKSIVDLQARGYLHETGRNSDRFEFVSVSIHFFSCIYMGLA